MRTITGLLIGALALSFCSGCAGSESTDVSAPKEVKYTKNMSAGRIPNPPIPEDPWSNDRIWSSLIESKSSTSFSAKINATLPSLTFRINGKFRDKDFHPSYVEIVDETDGRVAQKLFAKGKFDNHGHGFGRIDLAFADLVQLLDMNGDGYLDLRLLFETGATGNNWYATYLYQPKTKRFKYHKELSSLSGVMVDPHSKVITTYWRGGWCVECSEYFRLDKGDSLVLDKIEWTEIDRMNTDSGCLKYTGMPRNKRATYLGYAFYNMSQTKFEKFIRNEVKIVNKEEFVGNLDGRARGLLGNPYH